MNMPSSYRNRIYFLILIMLTFCILTRSQVSLFYAFTGLSLWYEKMLPSLVPFMILSGIMIRMHLTESFSRLLYPIVGRLFCVSRNGCYAIIIGFLCGFPMGAKTIADLLEQELLSEKEAEYLLAFCNNIGPVYFCSFVLPLLHRQLVLPYVIGMYGIPACYGIVLRHTLYREPQFSSPDALVSNKHKSMPKPLLAALDESVLSSMQSALGLCGYMILFNLLNLLPHLLLGHIPILLAPLFEITGGLSFLGDTYPLYTLLLLPFGGLSCIAQTYHCICNTKLSIAAYTLHKLVLTALCALYYLGWFLLAPSAFLR